MKKLLITLAFILPVTAHAAITVPWSATSTDAGFITPTAVNGYIYPSKVPYYVGTSTTQASLFPYASTTALSGTSLCLSSDCRTVWPTGGGTNYWTNSSTNTYLNTGSNAQAPTYEATSTTATSTFPLTTGARATYTTSTSTLRYAGGLTNANFNNFGWVKVYGNYAYGTSYGSGGSLSIIDISNPSKPKLVSQLTSLCTSPEGIDVAGRYAYITCYSTNSLKIVDVSNPASPFVVSTLTSSTYLNQAQFVSVVGSYAYVASVSSNNMAVIDVSIPANPIIVASYTDANIGSPVVVKVVGKYAYMTSSSASNTYLHIIDITNPVSPKLASATNIGFALAGFDFNGTTMYISKYGLFGSNQMAVVDVGDPTAPRLIKTITGANGYAPGAIVAVQGNYLYGTDFQSHFIVFDISSSTNPINLVSFTHPNIQVSDDIFLSGNYAYVTDQTSNTFNVIDVSGITTPSISAGSIKSDRLDVTDFINAQRIFANAGLTVGTGGILNQGTIFSSTTISNYFVGTSTATSTAKGGWNITGGCYAINGTCIGGGSGTNYWTNVSTTTTLNTGSRAAAGAFTATSTTATSTILGALSVSTLLSDQKLQIDGNISFGRRAQSAATRYLGFTDTDGRFKNTSGSGTTGMVIDQAASGNTNIYFRTGTWGSFEDTAFTIDNNLDVSVSANHKYKFGDPDGFAWMKFDDLDSYGMGLTAVNLIAASSNGNTPTTAFVNGEDSLATANVILPVDGSFLGIGQVSPSYPIDVYSSNSTAVRIQGSVSSAANWQGRIIAGGQSVAFLMGERNNQAWLGAHNAALNAWSDFYLNPDGGNKLYLGSQDSGGEAVQPVLTVTNASGNSARVGIGNNTSPSAKLHVIATTEQLRLGYDTSNYWSSTVGSTGATAFDAIGTGANFSFADNVGIGTSTPYAKLSVAGQIVGQYITATSTATSTFPFASINKNTFMKVSFGEGDGGQANQTLASFNRINFGSSTGYTLTDPGGNWNAANNRYVVPRNGTYMVVANVRTTDGTQDDVGIGTGNYSGSSGLDSATFHWQEIPGVYGGTRNTVQDTNIAHYNAGDTIIMFGYSDLGSTASDGAMTIYMISSD